MDKQLIRCAYSFFSNLLAVVFILLNLNAVMSVIFNVPAAIFSTVCVLYHPIHHTKFTISL